MSQPNIIVGVIQEAFPSYRPAEPAFFRMANDAMLAAIPVDDSWPPLCRAMLSVTGVDEAHGSFRGRRVIGIHAHLNNVVVNLGAWLDKFERLLGELYWTSAEVFVLQADVGECRLVYSVPQKTIAEYAGPTPRSPVEWELSAFGLGRREPCDPLVRQALIGRKGFAIT